MSQIFHEVEWSARVKFLKEGGYTRSFLCRGCECINTDFNFSYWGNQCKPNETFSSFEINVRFSIFIVLTLDDSTLGQHITLLIVKSTKMLKKRCHHTVKLTTYVVHFILWRSAIISLNAAGAFSGIIRAVSWDSRFNYQLLICTLYSNFDLQ